MYRYPRDTKLAVKKSRILNELFRSAGGSRFELARRLNMSGTMVGLYVDDLLQEAMLVEGEPVQSRPGRAPIPLQLNPEYGCFLGLDFEALRARAVLCDFGGDVIEQEEVAIRSGATREAVLQTIVSLARRVADRAPSRLLCVGIAAPGQVDCLAGRVVHYRHLADFDQVPVRAQFERVFDVPVFIEDNIRAVAFAELLRGSGRGSRDFLCLAVRSGVGLGLIINGKIYSGPNAMAGEVSEMVMLTTEGPRLITDLASAKGFVEATRALLESRSSTAKREGLLAKGDDLSLADIVEIAESGDALLQERLEGLGTILGILIANLANLFAPERIVLAGEVPSSSRLVRQAMDRAFRKWTLPQILKSMSLDDASLGGFAGALGAAWLGFPQAFPEDEEDLMRRITGKESGQQQTVFSAAG